MGKHTPAPWTLIKDKFGDYSIEVPAEIGVYVIADNIGGPVHADETGNFTDYSTVEANARLIAAAPSLLAELENIANAKPSDWAPEVRDQFQQWAQSRARAAIAIATATGETSHG